MRALAFINPAKIGLWVFFFGVIFFLLLPIIIVVPISFNPGTVLRFPPDGVSLRWYDDFFGDQRWRDVAWRSVRLGITVAVVATVIGLAAAVALVRFVTFGKALLRTLVLSPLIVPLIVTAIAMFDIFNQTGLLRTFQGLVLGHTILAVPFAVIIIEASLRNFDVALEEVAMSLGASRLTAFRKITMPIIAPSLAASAVFAFITSWDEVVMVLFLGGARKQTLPLRMFEFLTTEIRPTIAAISAMLFFGIAGVLIVYQLYGFWQQWRLRRALRAT